jgi:hypothetical protein
MEYMLVITGDETFPPPGPGEPGFEEMMAAWNGFTQRLVEGGHWISGASLMPSATATTVRKAPGGATTILDGPFLESKEQLGGYYTITAANLDEALELAAAVPIPAGAVEVRPLSVRPDVP